MRRLVIALSAATLLFVGGVVAGSPVGGTAGQPETAPSTEAAAAPTEAPVAAGPITVIELAPGFTAEVFAGAPSDRVPDHTVYVARFTIEPGSEIFPHRHPGTVVLGVASGTLGWTLLEGTAHVVRGAAAGNTGPVEDVTEPGTEVILEVGDSIYYDDDVVHTARGAGDETTVVLGSLVFPTGEPLLMPVEMDMDTASTTSAP